MAKYKIFLILLFGLLIIAPSLALADPLAGGPAVPITLNNPLAVTTPNALIANVIRGALGVVGSLALLMFIYGGFTWMLSGGNDKMIEKGRGTLTWAALGLVIIFMAYIIINFIFTKVLGIS